MSSIALKSFNASDLKDDFELKVPKLTIYLSSKHTNHSDDYQNKVKNRLNCNLRLFQLPYFFPNGPKTIFAHLEPQKSLVIQSLRF